MFAIPMLAFISLFISCQKDKTCDGCGNYYRNNPPFSNAGNDTTVYLPVGNLLLDGGKSYDPDGFISEYEWTKIFGPETYVLKNPNTAKCLVDSLVPGNYEFELKVTDDEGLSARDTLWVEAKAPVYKYVSNVCFYFRDPGGASGFVNFSFATTLINITIDSLRGSLTGYWGGGNSPRCPFNRDYNIDAGETGAFFDLNPGTYQWKAESTITDMSGYPGVSSAAVQFFRTVHSVSGTITIIPGDTCVSQLIVFP